MDGRYDVIAAVSFLDIALRRNDENPGPSVPVGYTEHLSMHPLDFEEFLWAKGVGDDTIAMLRSHIYDRVPIPEDMHSFLDSCFREFMVVGGMPEAVREYMDSERMDREAPSLSKVPSVFKVDRRMMFEDTNIRISDDGVEHYPLYASAFMDSMSDPIDIDSLMWTEPLDFDMV